MATDTLILAAKTELAIQLRDLYTAFARYPAPQYLHGSPVSDPEVVFRALNSTPLAQLTPQALDPYASSALTTLGDVNDYKHYLPRILELATVSYTQIGLEPQLIAGKLRYAPWHDWPTAEKTAIQRVFFASWNYEQLQHIDESNRGWDWLQAMAMLDMDIEACLTQWITDPTANAIVQLSYGSLDLKCLVRGNGWWNDVTPQKREEIINWLMHPQLELALTNAIDRVPQPQHWMIEQWLDALNALRSER